MRRSFGSGVRGRSGVVPAPSAIDQFLDAMWSITPGGPAVLWLPTAADTTTNTDRTYPNRIWTYDDDISARITPQGSGVLVSFASASSQNLTTPDTTDLSFVEPLTYSLAVLANITDTAAQRVLIAKYRSDSVNAEWQFSVDAATDKLALYQRDHSVPATAFRTSNAAIAMGALHLWGTSYDGGGGATAANGMVLFKNGAVIASTATNSGTYVAMENGTNPPAIGSYSNGVTFFDGSIGFAAVYAANLSTAQHAQIKVAVNTYFGTSL